MGEYCVVVADGVRARFFTLEAAQLPGMESGPNLVEKECLINPEGETPGHELWTGDKSGRSESSSGSPSHVYDDHRGRHMDEFMRRFASKVTGEAMRLAQEQKAKQLVLVSAKRMLGFLRESLVVPPKANIKVHELAKDLTQLSPQDLHNHLDNAGLIPKRKQPSAK